MLAPPTWVSRKLVRTFAPDLGTEKNSAQRSPGVLAPLIRLVGGCVKSGCKT